MTPYFSVVIPLYNKAQEITATLSSVLAQAFTDFEIIIINDGSTDDSLEIVQKINDERIRIFATENKGVSHARNFGIQRSRSKIIAFLDADDLWKPNHLKDLKSLFETYPNCGMYCKAYQKEYYNQIVVEGRYNGIEKGFNGILDDYFKYSVLDSIACSSAIAIPKRILDTHGYFDESLKSGQDTDLWIRIALKERTAFSSTITATIVFTNSNNHLSQSPHIKQRMKIIERYQQYETSNENLKKYLDLNRYSIALERKMNNDFESYQNLVVNIDKASLNLTQKILLKLPRFWIGQLKNTQRFLIKNNIYISAFR